MRFVGDLQACRQRQPAFLWCNHSHQAVLVLFFLFQVFSQILQNLLVCDQCVHVLAACCVKKTANALPLIWRDL